MDTLEQMRTYARIVETGSLSGAARGRRLSLAAVSRQLAALERELGATLVVRTTRRLQVTEVGQRWYAHCTRLLRELEAARRDVDERGAIRGTVTISAPITLGTHLVVPRLAALARAHPDLAIDLRLEDHVVDLVGAGVDLAVRGGIAPPDSSSLIAHPIAEFRRVAVAAPAYLRRAGTPRHPRDLARHAALVQRNLDPAFVRWRFEREDGAGDGVVELEPRAHLSSTTPMVLHAWAAAGLGIALIPTWLVDDRVRRVCDGWVSPPIRAWAIHRVEVRGAPRVRATLDALAAP